MLTIYTRKELIPTDMEYIRYNDTFFKGVALTDDSITKLILSSIDNAHYNSPETFIGRDETLVALNKEHLSTGTKTLLNIYTNPAVCFDTLECGVNCLRLLVDLSLNICGTVFMDTPALAYYGSGACDITCDGVHYSQYEPLFNKYYYGDDDDEA
jgi:hypothetical protein